MQRWGVIIPLVVLMFVAAMWTSIRSCNAGYERRTQAREPGPVRVLILPVEGCADCAERARKMLAERTKLHATALDLAGGDLREIVAVNKADYLVRIRIDRAKRQWTVQLMYADSLSNRWEDIFFGDFEPYQLTMTMTGMATLP